MKKSVKVDLSWRVWSLVVGFFILIGLVGLGFAYSVSGTGGNPAIMGHSADEIGFDNYSLSENGYQKLPSGLILQWGKVKLVSGYALVTLPTAFPNALLNVNAMYTTQTQWANFGYYPYHRNTLTPKTTFEIYTLGTASYNSEVYWQAIGY